jgi:hypothetical protein
MLLQGIAVSGFCIVVERGLGESEANFMVNAELIKGLLQTARNTQHAKEIMDAHTSYKSAAEKAAFLRGLFSLEIVSRHDDESVTEEISQENDYTAVLAVIVQGR